ncbi:MAG: T9SS type A sorting domain-containing protein [Chitinophagaceae bacterium]|nr:T9SS type A sorting domain-containing protein [Chitinophagaceae bacterium]
MRARLVLFFICLFSAQLLLGQGVTYYSKASGNANDLATWGTNTDGSGTAPASFILGDIFEVRNGSNLTTSAAFTIASTVSNSATLRIAGGGTLTASHIIDFINTGLGANFVIQNNGNYVHNLTTNISTTILTANNLDFQPGSNFSITTTGSHTNAVSAVFYNFLVNNSSTVSFTATSLYVEGTLTIATGSVLQFTNTSITNVLAAGGSFAVSGSGTLRIASSAGTPLPAGITWPFSVEYNRAAGSQNISAGTYSSLNTSGGDRTIGSGNTVTLTGNFTPGSGTFTLTGSTIEFAQNGALNIPNLPYNNLTISGTGTKTLTTDLTIAGALVISNSNADLDINGNTLTLNGNGSSFTGDLLGSSTSNLTIGGSLGSSPTIKFHTGSNTLRDLTLNRTGTSAGLTLGSDLTIVRRLNLTNGNLNVSNHTITLQSSSISNTAQVAAVGSGASVSYGSGGIRVERYIPSGSRTYRDISSGGVYTNTGFIYENWQESGATTAGLGTHITGLAGSGVDAATGLDMTATGNRSMHTYTSATWGDITNTKSTRLNPYQGYRILVRGDRNANITTLPTPTTMNRDTRLRATGQLIYGDITFSTGGVSSSAAGVFSSGYALNGSVSGYSLVANPFPAIIDFHAVHGASTNIENTYWYFDPTIGTAGGYVTYNISSGKSNPASNIGQYIQPGMAFFTVTTGGSPVLRINEAHKAPDQTLTNVYETPTNNPAISARLPILLRRNVNGQWINMDGATLVTGNRFSNTVQSKEDAAKFYNSTENLCFINRTTELSIDARNSLTEKDTLQLRIWQTSTSNQYQLVLIGQEFNTEGYLPYLEDRFLQTFTYIRKDTMVIPFTVTSAAASSGNRFQIVFRKIRPSGVQHGVKLEGQANAARLIQLQWAASTEQDMLQYEVEKSIDGNSFYFVGKKSSGEARNWTDMRAAADKTWYRIKQLMLDGSYQYSNMAYFGPEAEEGKQSLRVYPNPYKGGNIQLMLFNIPDDQYQVSIIDALGKQLSLYTFTHKGTQSVQVIPAGQLNPVKGVYQLQISGKSGRWTTKLIVD